MNAQDNHQQAAQHLLRISTDCGCWKHDDITHVSDTLEPGDVLVINDSGTLPGSIRVQFDKQQVELRLLGFPQQDELWHGVLFDHRNWTVPTEDRHPHQIPRAGDWITVGGLKAMVISVAANRLIQFRFDAPSSEVLEMLYREGKPIQYSYMSDEVPIEAVQTHFGGRPWSVEMPSALRPLTIQQLVELRNNDIVVVSLTHGAGISSIDEGQLDEVLPLPEWSDIPPETVGAILAAKRRGHRVIAVGTTVVRALEGRIQKTGRLTPGLLSTSLRLGPNSDLMLVDGLLTNMHLDGESHFDLMQAIASRPLLSAANQDAAERGYLAHEFGDITMITNHAAGEQPDACLDSNNHSE